MSPRQATAISLTKRLFLLIILGTTSVFLIKGIYTLGSAQSTEAPAQERKLKVTEFKDMPLAVEVRNLRPGPCTRLDTGGRAVVAPVVHLG